MYLKHQNWWTIYHTHTHRPWATYSVIYLICMMLMYKFRNLKKITNFLKNHIYQLQICFVNVVSIIETIVKTFEISLRKKKSYVAVWYKVHFYRL